MERFALERSKEIIRQMREKQRREDLRRQKREKDIQLAIGTVASVILPGMTASGVDEDRYNVTLEEMGFPVRPGESYSDVTEKAVRILIKNGKSAHEVADTIINSPQMRVSRSLGEYPEDRINYDAGLLTDKITVLYNKVMKEKH